MEDFAVIIGLQNYPALDDPLNGQAPISGAETDAKNFEEWAVSQEGGAVPLTNVIRILSSDYTNPANNLAKTQPTEIEITAAFDRLRGFSKSNREAGRGSRVGRRLYIFMSGHGVAPKPFGERIVKESALLMANVDPDNISALRYHIPGNYTASWFCENECFDEVFLFMDCCRDTLTVSSTNAFLPNTGNSDKAVRFFAFATKWSRRAKEKIIDGKMQGIFTRTLLLGLRGAGADPDPENPGFGVITGASLKSFLYGNIEGLVEPQFRNDADTNEPDIEYAPKAREGRNIIIKKGVPLQQFPVIVSVAAGASGKISILNGDFKEVAAAQINNPPVEIPFNLPRAVYLANCNRHGATVNARLEVTGLEKAGKELIVNL